MAKTITKQDQLDELAQKIISDKICPELAKGATQLVFSDGTAEAEVVFIGEAPGKDEDIQGKPFVGAAGKFLNQMIESLGWQRADVHITNIVKYRPPNNRDPLPQEVHDFLPYLLKQLMVIQPKLVVTLGRHALSVFAPQLRISQVHGQPKRIRMRNPQFPGGSLELVVLPLYHPAAALYNGGMRATLEADFAQMPNVLAKLSKTN